MAGSSGYNPGQFGPITDRLVHYDGPSGYVMDRPVPYVRSSGYVADRPISYAGSFGYGMNRPTYYAGPSDSTRVHTQTVQVAPYMTEPSGYSPRPFGPIADRPVLYDRRSGYETTQAAPYTTGQMRIYLRTVWPGRGPSGPFVGPSGHAYAEPRATQYTQFPLIAATLWCPTSNTL
jgi:hypothetical protein